MYVYLSGVVPGKAGSEASIRGKKAGSFWANELQNGRDTEGVLPARRRKEADMSNKWCVPTHVFESLNCDLISKGSFKIYVSVAKEPYKQETYIRQKRPTFL